MIKITISGNIDFSPSWQAFEHLVQSTFADPLSSAIVHISRRDGQCNYRAAGVYDAVLQQGNKEIPIEITVTKEN